MNAEAKRLDRFLQGVIAGAVIMRNAIAEPDQFQVMRMDRAPALLFEGLATMMCPGLSVEIHEPHKAARPSEVCLHVRYCDHDLR